MNTDKYVDIFISEAQENIDNLNEHLLKLEKEPKDSSCIAEIFRIAHSLKGMSATMGFNEMQKLTHKMEDVFSEIRADKMQVTSKLIDVLFLCLDALMTFVNNIADNGKEGPGRGDLIDKLDEVLSVKNEIKVESNPPISHVSNEETSINDAKYRIDIEIDSNCMLKGARAFLIIKKLKKRGEVVNTEPSEEDLENDNFEHTFSIFYKTENDIAGIEKIIKKVSEVTKVEISDAVNNKVNESNQEVVKEVKHDKTFKTDRTVKVDISKLDNLMNMVSELVITRNRLLTMSNDKYKEDRGLIEEVEYLDRVSQGLYESVMNVRMMPIQLITHKFPRMVRDLSRKLDKKIEYSSIGEDTELDRTVLDEIGEPIMHLLRNSADHGIESEEERINAGKDPVGHITLTAYEKEGRVVISVMDDGYGIDANKVKEKAIKKGLITREQSEFMTQTELIELLYMPGFSTSDKISEVSGRGVGLDVVKTKIESLGGSIEVKSEFGKYSRFDIHLPVTLAITQALLIGVGNEKYAVPIGDIQTIEDVNRADVKKVQKRDMMPFNDMIIPIIWLDEVLGIKNKNNTENLIVLIAKRGDRYVGVVVDDLLDNQELVVKQISEYIENTKKMFSGATILGDGKVALILNIDALY